eukprot:SAG31_NODE_1395_length_8516_cov_4.162885_7_plen_156_part_00
MDSLSGVEVEDEARPEQPGGPEPEPEVQQNLPGPTQPVLQPENDSMQRTRSNALHCTNDAAKWEIRHGRMCFAGEVRNVLDDPSIASSFEEAQQAKFLVVTGSDSLRQPFNKLQQNEAKVERVRLLMAIVSIMEENWGLDLRESTEFLLQFSRIP